MSDTPSRPSPASPTPPPRGEITPRFGRLLLVCGLAVAFCGFLVWFMATHATECCDLSWLNRWVS